MDTCWTFYAFAEVPASVWARWNALNRAGFDSPLLDAGFIRTAWEHFGQGRERLAVAQHLGRDVAMVLLDFSHSTRPCAFIPSQLPLCPWVQVAGACFVALPHGKASDKIVAAGEFVTLDFGALYQGYCSDMTRTLLVNGEGVSAEFHPLFDVYQIVLQAQLAAISAIRPGVRCQQVDDAARRVITEAGYGDYFGHNTGHAIGIEVHEDPRFSPRDTTTLQPGMLLTVEPGIYLPGQGGVRIEDVVLVTPQGAEVLYAMPKTVLLTGEA